MTVRRPIPSPEEVWRAYDRMEARLTTALSERMLDLAGLGAGMRVLDLATGRGEPAIPAAHRVGPSGAVLGIDVSESMLAIARQRAREEGVTNLELRAMDAASLEGIPSAHFHSALVRWGLMYMDSPVAALAGARRAVVPGGAVVVAVLAEPERCSYFDLPRRVLARYRSLPPIDPASPGPFRYADVERLRQDLARADLNIEHVEELILPVMEAETAPEVIAWVRAFGLTRLLNDLPESAQRSWEEEVAKEVDALRQDGFIRLGCATHVVVASEA
ncbi:MAG TPA: class I SAM-dependent methyltransferase [Polyangia bacterium]|jgi:ubiquinone/menaquinone biosynthesis C-methylase UbiE|nr:class I SAM-dependent methyltransferase [Polyangia bacterium]